MKLDAIQYKTKLKRGDTVQVIAGKSKNQVGKIISVDRKKGYFKIEGLNMMKKHVKPNQKNRAGGIIESEGPIHFSNVLLFDKDKNKGSRIRSKIVDGQKIREFVK